MLRPNVANDSGNNRENTDREREERTQFQEKNSTIFLVEVSKCVCMCACVARDSCNNRDGEATMSRLLEIVGLFCK